MNFCWAVSKYLIAFLFLIVSPTLLANIGSSTELTPERLTGVVIMGIIFVTAIIKSLLLVRRKETSNLCVVSLAVLLTGWLVIVLAKNFHGEFLFLAELTRNVGIKIILVATVLAVIGLLQYKHNSDFNQGRKQAISTLIIGGVILSLSGYGTISSTIKKLDKYTEEPQSFAKNYTFNELNFNYTSPATKYVDVNYKAFEDVASVAIKKSNPQIFFMIIAESLGVGNFTRDDLEDLVKTNLDSSATSVTVIERSEKELNGMSGLYMQIDARVSNKKISYRYWIYETRGFVFQLVSWTAYKNKDRHSAEFEELISGFQLQDQQKISVVDGKQPFGEFDSEYGFSIDLSDSEWILWADLEASYPQAEVGGEIGQHGFFHITPFCYESNRPHDDAIKSALFHQLGINFPNESMIKTTQVSQNKLKIESYAYLWNIDGTSHQAKFTSFIGEECSYLLSLWTNREAEETKEIYSALSEKINFDGASAYSKGIDDNSKKEALYNYTGLFYFDKENYTEALRFFKLSQIINSENPLYVNNIFETYNKLADYKSAILFIESSIEKLALDAESYSWLGWFYENDNQLDKAKKQYHSAFSEGYKNDQDLARYADMLVEENKLVFAEEVLEKYSSDKNSVLVLRKRASIKRKEKSYEVAFSLLELAKKDRPLVVDIVFDEIYIHSELGNNRKVIELADSLIYQGHASAGAFYQKGVAEYELSEYLKSKKSFESALNLAPSNENIKDYLNNVSGMLGQGDSSLISKEILPVEFAYDASEKFDDEAISKSYDSYFIEKTTSYQFTYAHKLRKTVGRKIKLLTQQGVERFSTIEIGFDPFYESAYVNQLEVFNEDNKLIYKGNRNDYYITDTKSDMADTDKTIHLPVSNLAPGYTIEYRYTTETFSRLNEFPFVRIFHSSSRPVANSFIYIAGDTDKITYQNTATSEPVKLSNSLLWIHQNPVRYINEPMQVKPSVYLPSVTINHKQQDWKALANDYIGTIEEKLIISDKVRELSNSLTKGLSSDASKLSAISRYIQNNITYKAIEFGVRGRVPNSAEQTINNRFGDCKDHAVLLLALLKAANIKSSLALANLSDRVNTDLPSLDQFDHMIVYIPEISNGLFVDTTDKDMQLIGRAPSNLGNSYVLQLEEDESQIRKIPQHSVNDNQLDIKRKINFGLKDEALVHETVSLVGYSASSFRNYLRSIEPREQFNWAERFLSEKNSQIELISLDVNNLLDIDKALILEFEYKLPLKKLENKHLLFDDISVWEYYFLVPDKVQQRNTQFAINYPIKLSSEVIFILPEGYSMDVLANNIEEKSSFGQSKLKWNKLKNHYTKSFNYVENSGIYEKEEYSRYIKFTKAAVSSLAKTIKVVP